MGKRYLKLRDGADLFEALKAMKMGESLAKMGWKKLARNMVESGMDKRMFNKGHTRWGNKRIRRKKAFRKLQWLFLDELNIYWEWVDGVPEFQGTFDIIDQTYNQLLKEREEQNGPTTSDRRDPESTDGTGASLPVDEPT